MSATVKSTASPYGPVASPYATPVARSLSIKQSTSMATSAAATSAAGHPSRPVNNATGQQRFLPETLKSAGVSSKHSSNNTTPTAVPPIYANVHSQLTAAAGNSGNSSNIRQLAGAGVSSHHTTAAAAIAAGGNSPGVSLSCRA